MTESAARRDRMVLSTAAPSFLWEVAQKPVSVSLTFELIDRMEREVVESFRSLTSRGSEIGGLLLGRVLPGSPMQVSVEDYEVVECDYSGGPLYRLSATDLGRLERAMEQRAASGGLQAVGFFRSHTRKGLSLGDEDLAFLEAHFPESHHVALLVRPFATKASIGAIFIRENGTIRGESSYQEFPFRSSQLTATKRESGPIRAQIVPIASRREISLAPPPAAIEEPPAPAIAEPQPAPTMVLLTPEPPPPQPVQTPPAIPETNLLTPEDPPKNRRWGLIGGIAAAVAALLLALFFVPGPWHSSRRIPQTSAEADSLNLRVEHSGADLLLTWNRDAAPIQNAGRAVLSIADGDRQEGYVMDLAQLRTGSIVYAPLSSDVSFRLDLTQHDRRTVVGTVRMLRTRPSPMPTDSQPETVVKAKPEPAHPAESNDSAPADASETESPAPVMAAAPIKPFDASSLAARLHPARPAEQPDAPSLGGGVPVSPRVITDTPLPFATPAMAPPPPPAASPAAAPEHTAAESLGMGGHIQQAELLSRREPVYPALARQMGARGVVELIASIGADGRVKAVRVVRGQPVLAKAASDAVMQWVYRPTMLNGIAVPNETRITLNFLGK